MKYLPAMDWSAKWDWENLVMFNSKTVQSPKKQPTDWGIEGEGEIDTCSFNLSGGGSVSDFAQASSARSSISASTDSSSKEVMKMSKIGFEAFHTFPGEGSKKSELTRAEVAGTSPPLECSGGSGEQLIGLKLGKRTYFENNCARGNAKISSLSGIPVSSDLSAAKKIKSSCQTPPPCCQVEGCNLDLSSAKEYHRKHRVCASHSKCPKVVVGGLERRFCQQCSRFHSLSEFDEKKRSCRRRLSDHNARRRKPPQDTLEFNSRRLSSPFLDGRQQMSFILNNASPFHTRPPANPMWESSCSSKFTITKVNPLKSETTRGIDWQLQLPHTELAHASSMLGQNSNKPLPYKGTKHEVFDQGLKEDMLSSNYDAVPELHRALSLLSTDSWGSAPTRITFDHPIHENLTSSPQPVMMLGVPHSLPLASSPYWQIEHSTETGNVHNLTANDSSHFQEIQLFKAPYENGLFPNLSN